MARQIIIIALLAVSIAYALFTYWPVLSPLLPKFGKPQPAVTAPAAAPSREAVTPLATKEAEEFELVVPSIEAVLVDPFALRIEVKTRAEVPLPSPTPAPGEEKPAVKPVEPKLEGIWVGSEMKVAFISGQALPVGGKVMGWKVVTISKEYVVLQKGSATKTLKLEGK